jgi:2-aminoadipate transaminase
MHNSAQRPYASGVRISFAVSRPPEELFPLEDFRQSCQEVLAGEQLGAMLQLGPAAGYEPLRQYLVEEARREGAFGRDDDLLITNGCQQALDLLRRVLVRPGMRVAVEDPVYPGLKNLLLAGGADVVALPATSAIAVITPNFQNPTGLTMPLEDRQDALRAARQHGTVLIENDIYSALRYEGEAIPSLKQMAPDSGTVLLRSFSKVAFPGIRLGWVIGPRPLIAAMRQTKQTTDLHSDQFSQAVMLRFAESGRLAAHVGKMIEAGRERLRVALQSAGRFLPAGSSWTRPEGGMNLWITLPAELDAAFLLDRAERDGVAYLPGSVFTVSRPANNALRLSFGGSAPDEIRRGMEILGGIFSTEQAARRRAEWQPMAAMV